MRLAITLATVLLSGLGATGQTTPVSVQNVVTSLNMEASRGEVPFDTINITLDLILRNGTNKNLRVAAGAVQAVSVERRLSTDEWKTILTIDGFFDVSGRTYPQCIALKPGKGLSLPQVWSNVVLPKTERDPDRPVWLRLRFIAQCTEGKQIVDQALITEPFEIRHVGSGPTQPSHQPN